MLAQVLMDLKEYDEAIEVYQQVLQEQPDDGESQFAIALIQLQQKQLDSAQQSLEALLHNPAWSAQASFYLGRIEFGEGNYDQAIVWFDKVTQGPYAFDAAMTAVSVLLTQQRFEEAALRIDELEKKYPLKRLRVLMIKSELYNRTREYHKAFDILTEALRDYPDNRDLLYTRALIAEQIDKLDVLEEDLRKILAKKPDDAAALNALGYTLVDRTDRYDEAEKYILQALRLQPDAAVIIDSYGWLQYKQGNMQQAMQYLQKAFDKEPENEIAAHLAEVLWMSGDKKGARRIFEKAFKDSPDDQYLLDFQKRFLLDEE
jgi:tetratricopeptide (TPR) repeat protein